MKKTIFLVSLILCTFFIVYFTNQDNNKYIAVYLDNIESAFIPDRNSNYVIDKVVCDNDTIGTWDYINWGLQISNVSKRSNCKLYFVTKDEITIANTSIKINEYGKCSKINFDGTISVNQSESENGYICQAPNDYGLSYYYRGNVKNNYVYFAGFYWRILRINGDESIRIIYDGTSAHENGEISDDRIIGNSVFNEQTTDNCYVGYMYGTPDSSTYVETHANVNDSTIKEYLNTWYENNIKNTSFADYLTDNIFCNDRTINNSDYIKNSYPDYKNNGYSKNGTVYRWDKGPWNDSNSGNNNMLLYCLNNNDKFSIANGNLTYPIGLITADELLLSGIYRDYTSKYNFLCSSNNFWTMSASDYNERGWAGVQIMNECTFANSGGMSVDNVKVKVKPVINIKKSTLQFGDGTDSNPYRINKEL